MDALSDQLSAISRRRLERIASPDCWRLIADSFIQGV
jgi:hypothetical protein